MTQIALGWKSKSMARWRAIGGVPVLTLVLILAIVLGTAIGATNISPLYTAQIILNATHLVHIPQQWDAVDSIIILQLRLPRVLGAALIGAALGASGTLFQGLLRNPLADPLLLGTSSGAALGVTIVFLSPSLFVISWAGFSLAALMAFIGALVAVALVYRLATRRGQTPVVTLLLAGVAVSAILTAFQTLLVSLSTRLGLRLNDLYGWISGNVAVGTWQQVGVLTTLVALGLVAAIAVAPILDAFALGEEMAAYVGVRVEAAKLGIVILAALLVAAAVAGSGLVGFVGLVAPHLCRMAFGPRHRLLLPTAALAGAIFVVLADLIARSIVAPAELPLGVVTALVGGPFFIWLLGRAGTAYRW